MVGNRLRHQQEKPAECLDRSETCFPNQLSIGRNRADLSLQKEKNCDQSDLAIKFAAGFWVAVAKQEHGRQ
jgi:hypothetical protein